MPSKKPTTVKPTKKEPGAVKTAPRKPARKPKEPATPLREREPTAKPAAQPEEKPKEAAERYWEGVGRRKTSVARVRLFTRGGKGISVNGKPLAEYFRHPHLQRIAEEALETMKSGEHFRASVHVKGGGLHSQAEAIRHGAARALVLFNPEFRKRLKRAKFLTRDPRMKERKKFGLKGARRAPQWAKR